MKHIEKLREAAYAIQPAVAWTTDPHKETGRAAHRALEEAISLTRMYAESREREVSNLESENQRLRAELQRIIDADRNAEHAAAPWDRQGILSEMQAACTVDDESGPTMPYAVRLVFVMLEELGKNKPPKTLVKWLIESVNNKLKTVRGNALVEASHAVQALR